MENVAVKKNIKKMEGNEERRSCRASDFLETLIGVAIAWSCVAACAGGCMYVCNHFRDQKKSMTKQEQIPVSLVKNKQIELQR